MIENEDAFVDRSLRRSKEKGPRIESSRQFLYQEITWAERIETSDIVREHRYFSEKPSIDDTALWHRYRGPIFGGIGFRERKKYVNKRKNSTRKSYSFRAWLTIFYLCFLTDILGCSCQWRSPRNGYLSVVICTEKSQSEYGKWRLHRGDGGWWWFFKIHRFFNVNTAYYISQAECSQFIVKLEWVGIIA